MKAPFSRLLRQAGVTLTGHGSAKANPLGGIYNAPIRPGATFGMNKKNLLPMVGAYIFEKKNLFFLPKSRLQTLVFHFFLYIWDFF